jgi:hypothetical protein
MAGAIFVRVDEQAMGAGEAGVDHFGSSCWRSPTYLQFLQFAFVGVNTGQLKKTSLGAVHLILSTLRLFIISSQCACRCTFPSV